MDSYKNYKYKEVDYAKYIYENGFQTKHIPTEMKLLLVYARDYLNVKKSKLKDFAYNFCEDNVDEFNRLDWFRVINKAVGFASDTKNRLINISQIDITSGELEYIMALPVSHDYKKIFLAFLVQMKLSKQIYEFKNGKEYTSQFFKGGIKKYNDVKKMANVPTKLYINAHFIREMSVDGYISIYYNGLIKHLWMDQCLPSGDVVMVIKDYENVGYYLDYYCGEKNMALCRDCQQPFKVSRANRKYCAKHKDYYKKMVEKEFTCPECGKIEIVPAKSNNQKRCAECQTKHRITYFKTRCFAQNK